MPAQGRRGKRKFNARSLVLALDGPEKPYPVYEWGNRKKKVERPRHNPFPAPVEPE